MHTYMHRVFAEMRSYIDPSPTILYTVQALLYILHPDGEFDTWTNCKQVCMYACMLASGPGRGERE